MEGNANAAGLASRQVLLVLSKSSNASVQEIEKYVNRPIEVRCKEIEKKQSHIPRPMNSFMLYRKAYHKLAIHVSGQSHHATVSGSVAASWRHETPDVKAKFAKYAQIEKDNHKLAFPTYRFKSKPKRPAQVKQREKASFDTNKNNRSYLGSANDLYWEKGCSKTQGMQVNERLLHSKDHGHSPHEPRYHNDLRSILDATDPLNLPLAPQQWQSQGIAVSELPQFYFDTPYYGSDNHGQLNLADSNSALIPSHASEHLGAGTTLLDTYYFGQPIQPVASNARHFNSLAFAEDPGFTGAFTPGEFDQLRFARFGAG